MRGVSLLLFLTLIFAFGQNYKEFETFKKEYLKEYEDYRNKLLKEFEEYKRIVYEEFKAYKEKIMREWGEYEATNKRKWVEYVDDYKVKRVFDFKTGELRIEFKGKKPTQEELYKQLEEFVKEDKATAFKNFEPINNIEKRVKEKLKHVVTGKVERKSILAPYITGKERYTEEDIRRGLKKLLRKGYIKERKLKNGEKAYVFVAKLPKKIHTKIRLYKPYVEKEARKWKLEEPLIFAIIHTESYYNPMATSPVPAYGLMQIVPRTAGLDATPLIFGKAILLSPSFLYNGKNNIRVGTAYLYKLYYVYFKDVKDPESRLYCVIAAYNTGPGNVAYAFTGTKNLRRAIKVINSMTPNEVYRTLLRNLPYKETKYYLVKVSKRMKLYAKILR